jgi:hypothetical protein
MVFNLEKKGLEGRAAQFTQRSPEKGGGMEAISRVDQLQQALKVGW